MDILNLKANEITEKIKKGELKAVDVAEVFLKNISEDKYNTFITVTTDEALKKAKEIDEKIAVGEEVGALAGVPVTIKDNISVKDVRLTCASKMLKNYISPYDATLVKKLKAEDALIVGKVNMDEFAMGSSTKTSYFGPTKNPLDEDLVPGGSSGGSASSVAGYEAVLSVGTDTGGSVRQPASFCGIVGMKPSYGSISRYGISTMANTFDSPGAFGKNVEDVHALLKAIVGRDEKDASSIGNDSIKNLVLDEKKSVEKLKGLKVAVPDILESAKISKEVRAEFEKAIEILKSKGATVDYIPMDDLKYGIECYHILVNGEIAPNMARFDGLRYGYRTEDYENVEEMYRKSRSEAFGDEVKRRIMIGTHILSMEFAKDYYEKALKVRTLIINDFKSAFENYDVVMCPTSPTLPYRIDYDITAVEMYLQDLFTVCVNIAGLPGISVPMPLKDGLSVGIQFIGKAFEDGELLEIAQGFERSSHEL